VRRAVSIALTGVALTLIALMFATAPLLVPGVALTLIGLAAPAWVGLAARGASVHRDLKTGRVIEGDPLEATIEVRAPRLRLTASEVIEPLTPVAIALPAGAPSCSLRIELSFDRRGRHRIEPPSLRVRDPLEIAERVVAGADAGSELLVLPRTSPLSRLQDGSGDRGSDVVGGRAQALAAVELDGLRPYRPGTSAARIHWPALARGAGLLERRLRAETESRPLVVLDARGAVAIEHLDAAVRAAASLVLTLAREGGCGLVLPGERRPTSVGPELSAWPAAHARLAVVQGGPQAPAPALRAARARLGPVFYVAAQALDRLPAAAHGIARGTAVLVFPTALARAAGAGESPLRASFEVAGCFGYVIHARRYQQARHAVAASRHLPGEAAR
jgi:uncharacterized protein (DUF58 family)